MVTRRGSSTTEGRVTNQGRVIHEGGVTTKDHFSVATLAAFARSRVPELALFLLGTLLRATMAWRYDVTWSYDAEDHWAVVRWIAQHWHVPPVETMRETFHPPLYYFAAAILYKLGVSRAGIVWLSIVSGIVRLGLIWAGLEVFLPKSRVARIGALAIAAVLAASVHVDGMAYGEPLSGMWIAAIMFVVPFAFRRPPRRRLGLSVVLGILFGLAMLTKISAVGILVAVGVTAVLEAWFSREGLRARAEGLAMWAIVPCVCALVCGWYFARNVRDYGQPFVTSFDVPAEHWLVAEVEKVPYLDRRDLAYVFGWSSAVYDFPYYPSAIRQHPRFFPVAVASTFVDFWNYSFSGIDPSAKCPMWTLYRPMSREALALGKSAMVGGTAIFAATVMAWFLATPRAFERRDWGMLSLLLMPLFMLILALHFAIKSPIDTYGVVKGAYMQFGAPPLYALFGVALAWSLRSSARWPLFAALLGALWLVTGYTLYCRLRIPIVPFS